MSSILQGQRRKGATTQFGSLKKRKGSELLYAPGSSLGIISGDLGSHYEQMMKPLRVEGFEDFVSSSLKNFDANQIKTTKYKSTVPFEVLSRIKPAGTPS